MLNADFTLTDLTGLISGLLPSASAAVDQPDLRLMYEKLYTLHRTVLRRLHEQHIDLHGHPDRAQTITPHSMAGRSSIPSLNIPYLRSPEQARAVERMIGREPHAAIDVPRHPVIEVRLCGGQLAVELIVSPAAWWDQRNLIGKLSVPRHRQAFRALIERLPAEVMFGFWDGLMLSDAHVSARQLVRGGVLEPLFKTFSEGHDWLRAGIWYSANDPLLSTDAITFTLTRTISVLYPLYLFSLWTSSNNFHTFAAPLDDAFSAGYGKEM